MITGLIIIAVILGFGIFDFYNTRSWQMVTSADRNDKVFENRNKAYGAYEIRRNYDKRLIVILISLISGIGLTSAAVTVFRDNRPQGRTVKLGPMENFTENDKKTEDDKVEDTKDEKKATTEKQQAMQKFVEFKINDKIIQQDTVGPIEDGKLIGTDDHQGKDEFGGNENKPTDDTNGEQDTKEITQDDNGVPFDITEEAYFQGGKGKMIQFIVNNISKNIEFSGTCKVRFVVKKDGSIGKIWVVKKVPNCPECDQSVVETVQKMPLWVPAKQNGTPVNSYFILPVTFE